MSKARVISFKYEKFIRRLKTECPPKECASEERLGFRYVFEEKSPEESFLPVLKMQPTRRINKPSDWCDGYALSFFMTEDKALENFNQLKKRRPEIHLAIGDLLAAGRLDKNDGVMSQPNKSGHFSLHEFANVQLSQKFNIVCKLSE